MAISKIKRKSTAKKVVKKVGKKSKVKRVSLPSLTPKRPPNYGTGPRQFHGSRTRGSQTTQTTTTVTTTTTTTTIPYYFMTIPDDVGSPPTVAHGNVPVGGSSTAILRITNGYGSDDIQFFWNLLTNCDGDMTYDVSKQATIVTPGNYVDMEHYFDPSDTDPCSVSMQLSYLHPGLDTLFYDITGQGV